MKYIKYALLLCLIFSCQKKRSVSDIVPEYNLIVTFSERVKSETGLVLSGYGINNSVPKGINLEGKTYNFSASYHCFKSRDDEISIDFARSLVVSITEALRQEIDADSRLYHRLFFSPFPSTSIQIMIHFLDDCKIDLGQGVACLYFFNGKIVYQGYEIWEYTGKCHARGKHFDLHEESYAEALEIVKNQGSLIAL